MLCIAGDFGIRPPDVERLDSRRIDGIANACTSRCHARDDGRQWQLFERRDLSRNRTGIDNRTVAGDYIRLAPRTVPSLHACRRLADGRRVDLDETAWLKCRTTCGLKQRAEHIAPVRIHPGANDAPSRLLAAGRDGERMQR